MYSDSHNYLLSEKGLVFYLYLQKFPLDFSLSTVIFAAANFDKRKFFFRHPVYFLAQGGDFIYGDVDYKQCLGGPN